MRIESVVRYIGLLLFLLFPLVSLLQLGDSDGDWRQAADHVRPSVVLLHQTDEQGAPVDGAPIGCGIVVQSDPLRLVTAGGAPRQRLSSHLPDGWVQWSLIYSDVQGQFCVLQAESDLYGESQGAASFVHAALPAAPIDLDRTREVPDGFRVALVSPRELESEQLWVGVLTHGQSVSGRRTYHTELLRPIRSFAAISTATARADVPPAISTAMRGAPFIDRHGSIVAVYLGSSARGVRALPIEVVTSTLVLLHLQAAH